MKHQNLRTIVVPACMGFVFFIIGTFASTYAQEEKHEQGARPQKQEQQARPEQQPQQQEQHQQEKVQQEQQQQPQQQAKPEKQEQQPQTNIQQKQQQQQPKSKKKRKPKQQAQSPQGQQPAKSQQVQKPQASGLQKQEQSSAQQQQAQVKSQPVKPQVTNGLQKQQASQPAQQARPVQKSEQQGLWQQHRAQSWQTEHRTWQQRGGYNGYRIPDDHFRGYFGPEHGFRIYSLSMENYGGYPRFQYNGFWFGVLDPWPEYWPNDWYENDDVYIDYSDDGYYMYNRRYPRDRIAVTVYVN